MFVWVIININNNNKHKRGLRENEKKKLNERVKIVWKKATKATWEKFVCTKTYVCLVLVQQQQQQQQQQKHTHTLSSLTPLVKTLFFH